MPDVNPFSAVTYDPDRVSVEKVIAPPYDIISETDYQNLMDRDPHNVVRLILTGEEDAKKNSRTKYEQAAWYWGSWLDDRILIKDPVPGFYVYLQTFDLPDQKNIRRIGFIGSIRLEKFYEKNVFPHERTFARPVEDRMNILRHCRANFSQTLMVYDDPDRTISKLLEQQISGPPMLTAKDENQILHQVWKISDPKTIGMIKKEIKNKDAIIADGHHRYTASMNYRDEQRNKSKLSPDAPEEFMSVYLTNLHDPGTVILPTHRVVRTGENFQSSIFLRKLEKYFDVRKTYYTVSNIEHIQNSLLDELKAAAQSKQSAIGLIIRGESGHYLIQAKLEVVMTYLRGRDIPEPLRKIDLTVLHHLILNQCLDLSEEKQESAGCMDYVKDHQSVFEKVSKGEYQLGFIMNPVRPEQIMEVVKARELLPYKSTFFYPKLMSGLIMRRLDE